jgi:ectoine hydroxylase
MANPFVFGKQDGASNNDKRNGRGPLNQPTGPSRTRTAIQPEGDLRDDGYKFIPRCLSPSAVGELRHSIENTIPQLEAGAVIRDNGGKPRMAFGTHLLSEAVANVARHNPWTALIADALGGPVYVYQTKLTINPSNSEAGWGWHRDFSPWQHRDQVPAPMLMSAIVFLTDIGSDSGGLSIVRGSHQASSVDATVMIHDLTNGENRGGAFATPVSPLGPAGSVLIFHSLTVHGSAPNLSPDDRHLLIITYNRCSNLPKATASPDWLSARDTTPLLTGTPP